MKVTLPELLQRLGLGKNASNAYAYLYQHGDCAVGQLATATGIPRTKAYICLRDLVRRGLIFEIPHKPRRFKAVSIETLKSIVVDQNRRLSHIPSEGRFGVPIFLTLGQANVMRLYPAQNAAAKKENLSIVHVLKSYLPSLNKARQAIKRGVKMKILALDTKESRQAAVNWRKIGTQVKLYTKQIPEGLRFSLFDDRLCRITIGRPQISESENYATVWIESKPIVQMLREYFYAKWREVGKQA